MLEHADAIWDPHNKLSSDMLEALQKKEKKKNYGLRTITRVLGRRYPNMSCQQCVI